MLLAKSCEKKDNIRNGTLKLGSLHEYRSTENKQIADAEEGVLKFNIKFDGTVSIDTNLFNTIFSGVIGSGSKVVKKPNGHFEAQLNLNDFDNRNPKFVSLTNSSATIKRESLNSFIFCVSAIDEMQECVGIFPNYDDCWYIKKADTKRFGIDIGKILTHTIKREYKLKNYIVPKGTDMKSLKVLIRHDLVSYIPRDIHITNESNFTLGDFWKSIQDMAFIKPLDPFGREKEYRFHYTLVSDNKIIVPQKNNLILDAERLQKYILQS